MSFSSSGTSAARASAICFLNVCKRVNSAFTSSCVMEVTLSVMKQYLPLLAELVDNVQDYTDHRPDPVGCCDVPGNTSAWHAMPRQSSCVPGERTYKIDEQRQRRRDQAPHMQ